MDYKSMIGFGKKKTIKEQPKPKPKKNLIIEGIKKDLKEWNDTTFRNKPKRWSNSKGLTEFEQKQLKEVGASADYHKLNKQIEKSYRKYWDDVQVLEKIMIKKGLKIKAKEIHKAYAKHVLGFQAWLRAFMDRLL